MATRTLLTCAFVFTGSLILSAQSLTGFQTGKQGSFDLASTVGLLEQNALLVLIGAITLTGVVWLCYILKTCAAMDRPTKNNRKSSAGLLMLFIGLSVFSGGCSATQREMARRFQAASAAENRNCPLKQFHENHANMPFNNRCYGKGYTDWQGPTFCKFCGQRMYKSHD